MYSLASACFMRDVLVRGRRSELAGRPLTNPHPRDASGADYVRVKFKLRLRRINSANNKILSCLKF